MTLTRPILTGALVLLLTACATTTVDSSILNNARFAIQQAEAAGAEEYAPLEMRFARESYEVAEQRMGDLPADSIRRLADEAEAEAQLALARTRGALARESVEEARTALEALRRDLVDAFGRQVLE